MALGAMHIHISILLYALDGWFLARHLLGHACIVSIQLVCFSAITVLLFLVTRFSIFWWILIIVRLNVSENPTCSSDIHVT